jgi:conjugal transfer/type IV secretion protein DotA/TraY
MAYRMPESSSPWVSLPLALPIFLLLILFSSSAFAQSFEYTGSGVDSFIGAMGDNDLSAAVFRATFGEEFYSGLGAFGPPEEGHPMGKMFMIFCSGLLATGLFWAAWNGVSATVATAEGGKFMGQRMSGSWVPIRFTIGISTLLPVFAGYCGAQVLYMWLAKIASGMANLMVIAAMPTMSGPAYAVEAALNGADPRAAIEQLFDSHMCMQGVNKGLQGLFKGIDYPDGMDIEGETIVPKQVAGDGRIQYLFHRKSSVAGTNSAYGGDVACGGISYDVKAQQRNGFGTGAEIDDGFLWTSLGQSNPVDVAFEVNKTSIEAMNKRVSEAVTDLVAAVQSGSIPPFNMSEKVNQIANLYNIETREKYRKILNTLDDKSLEQAKLVIENQGWMGYGSFYQIMTRNLNVAQGVFGTQLQVYPSNPDLLAIDATRRETIALAESANIQQTNADEALKSMLNQSLFAESFVDGATWLLTGDEMQDGTDSLLKFQTVNPIFQFKSIGDNLLNVGAGIVTAVIGADLLARLAGSKWKLLSSIGKKFVKEDRQAEPENESITSGAMSKMGGFITMLLVMLFIFGFFLAIYIPMLPFITWYGALLAWYGSLVESIVAAPVGSFAHLDVDGDGLGQRTQHSYLFAFNVILRPACMIFGFAAASLGVMVMGNVLLMLFGPAVASVQSNGSWFTGLFMMAGLLVILISLALTMVHAMFNLVHIIPDQIVGWAGGQVNTQLGKDTDDRAKSVFMGGFGKTERAMEMGSGKGPQRPPDTPNGGAPAKK